MKKVFSIVLVLAFLTMSLVADDGHIPGGRYCPPDDPMAPCVCPTVSDPNAVCQDGGRAAAVVNDDSLKTIIRLTVARLILIARY